MMISEGAKVAGVIVTSAKLLLVGPSIIQVRPSVIRASVKILPPMWLTRLAAVPLN